MGYLEVDLKDKKTRITFFEGMKTIGGTMIEVSFEDQKILFDFGALFNPNVDESKLNSLEEILSNNLAPNLVGYYDKRFTGEDAEFYKNKAVFLSHTHLDHVKMLNYLDEDIPVYTSVDTKNIIEALNSRNDFLFPNHKNEYNTRKINGVGYEEIVNLGKISVELVRVDHNGYGACGFLIKTPDLNIAYTGDIRFHGFRIEDSLNFIEKASGIDILIMEGVMMSWDEEEDNFRDRLTETQHIKKLDEILKENLNTPITFNYYETDVERILHFIETAKNNNRELVLTDYHANIIKNTTGIDVKYYRRENIEFYLNPNSEITFEELLNDNGRYLWQFVREDIDLLPKLKKSTIYLHCDAAPLGDFDPSYEPFVKKYEENEIKLILLKVSGHAYPQDLLKLIDEIKPKILIPIHSLRPEMLYNNYGERIMPEKNQII